MHVLSQIVFCSAAVSQYPVCIAEYLAYQPQSVSNSLQFLSIECMSCYADCGFYLFSIRFSGERADVVVIRGSPFHVVLV